MQIVGERLGCDDLAGKASLTGYSVVQPHTWHVLVILVSRRSATSMASMASMCRVCVEQKGGGPAPEPWGPKPKKTSGFRSLALIGCHARRRSQDQGITEQGWLGSTPAGRHPQTRCPRAGGSLAVASSTPATQLLSPSKILKLNHAWRGSVHTNPTRKRGRLYGHVPRLLRLGKIRPSLARFGVALFGPCPEGATTNQPRATPWGSRYGGIR